MWKLMMPSVRNLRTTNNWKYSIWPCAVASHPMAYENYFVPRNGNIIDNHRPSARSFNDKNCMHFFFLSFIVSQFTSTEYFLDVTGRGCRFGILQLYQREFVALKYIRMSKDHQRRRYANLFVIFSKPLLTMKLHLIEIPI